MRVHARAEPTCFVTLTVQLRRLCVTYSDKDTENCVVGGLKVTDDRRRICARVAVA